MNIFIKFLLTFISKKYKIHSLSYESAKFWGHSSVGRAPALQAGGRQFESDWLHQDNGGGTNVPFLSVNTNKMR